MQGRLSTSATGQLQEFPRAWEDEFPLAAAAGIAAIEWLYDDYDANPIETDEGVGRLRALSAEHRVAVPSLCAHRLLQGGVLLDHLLERCARAGIERVVLPFLDGLVPDATYVRPGVVIESDLDPAALVALGAPVNYDTGNARGRGIDLLGPLIRSVHLKDVDDQGRNVPLGEGTVDFEEVFTALRAAGYDGDLVLETPRPVGDRLEWARRQVAFVERYLDG